MTITIRQITPVFAGEVSGIDLTRPLPREAVAAIEAGMDRYAVLVFHDQRLTDDAQRAFTRNFGTLEASPGGHIATAAERRLPLDMQDASIWTRTTSRWSVTTAGACSTWATDCGTPIAHTVPCRQSIRCCQAASSWREAATPSLPTCGRRTMRWTMEQRPTSRTWCASIPSMFSRGALRFTEMSEAERAMFRAVRQRLVRTHPVTGRKSLFLSAHAGSIVGWPMPEARAFLRDLVEHATQPQFVYSHKWRQWDLVMWDNRQTMHRVTRFDEIQVRDMRRTTVAGNAMTAAQAA